MAKYRAAAAEATDFSCLSAVFSLYCIEGGLGDLWKQQDF